MATYYLINATRIGTRLKRIKQTGGSIDDAQAGMVAAASKADADSTDAATVANATATNVAEARSFCVRYEAPIAADLVTIKAAADVANGAITIAAQPDYPRKLQVRIVDANSSISAGNLTLVGVGPSGEVVGQVIPLAGGTRTVVTDQAYASIDPSSAVAGLVGAATGDTLGIGPSAALGLPGQKTPGSTTFAVHKANVDNANEAVGTVDATAGTVTPTTAPNGTHTYQFWYTAAVTVAQNAHTHTATLS